MNDLSTPADAAIETEVGWISLRLEGPAIRGLTFDDAPPAIDQTCPGPGSAAARQAVQGFLESGGRVDQAPPLHLAGTPFQQRVWALLRRIPPGVTRTYGELARQLGTAPRAVGAACRTNPIPLFVPCHRVVAASGAGGYFGRTAGRWLEIKRWLLAREGVRLG